jgi:hypothetical protein
MDNEWQENQFVKDTIRQLKSGMPCYIFKESQLEEIKEKYKEKTGIELECKIEKVDYYFIITPKKQLTERRY